MYNNKNIESPPSLALMGENEAHPHVLDFHVSEVSPWAPGRPRRPDLERKHSRETSRMLQNHTLCLPLDGSLSPLSVFCLILRACRSAVPQAEHARCSEAWCAHYQI
jgi:hypothetical protein